MHSKVELQVPNNPVKCPKMTNKSDEDYIEHGV